MRGLERVLARPGEPLTVHTERVGQRVGELAALHPLPQYPRLWQRLGWAALLHDSGKLAAGFQRGLRSRRARWGQRHEVLSLAFLPWFRFDEDDLPWVVAAVATHHRDADDILTHYLPLDGDDPAADLVAEVTPDAARRWYDWLAAHISPWALPLERPFAPPDAPSIHRALRLLADWLPTLDQSTVLRDEATLLRGYLRLADCAAAAGAPPFRAPVLPRERLPSDDALYPHQRACQAAPPRPALLLAPTGSGKTEAGLLWAGEPPRLLYLLPYRASVDAMTVRLERIAGAGAVGVTHGRVLNSLYRRLANEGAAAAEALAGAKTRTNLARLHAYGVRVATPYHLLRAAYQFDGFENTLADLHDARVIVDELHVYEPKPMAQIVAALRLLHERFRVLPLIMTATLPPPALDALRAAFPDLYRMEASRETYAHFQRHRVRRQDGDLLDALDTIAGHDGARLVTVNTVRRARAVTAALRARGVPVLTLHSRFAARDRWTHEQRLLQLFGAGRRGGKRAENPVVVATQVIEVSLDVDFDVLYSDPAPLEALVQRFGRVNRRRDPPALADVHVFAQPTGEDERRPIYDPDLVQASLRVLTDGAAVDEGQVNAWLAAVYSGARADAWLAAYQLAYEEFTRAVLEPLRPFASADRGLAVLFAQLFDGVEALPLALEADYETAENPLEAAGLLVPLAYWQYKMLEAKGLAWTEDDRVMVDVPYSPDAGLLLDTDNEGGG